MIMENPVAYDLKQLIAGPIFYLVSWLLKWILISEVESWQQLGLCYCMEIKITPPSQLVLKPINKTMKNG